MKRTPLRRKTRLRTVSKKKQREKRLSDKERADYVKRTITCECCLKKRPEDCHEMASGGSRAAAVKERCCWLAIYRECHDRIHHDYKEDWPLARQLAAKKLADPKYYDRQRVLEIKHLALTAVTEEEVDEWRDNFWRQ